jgi:hypothetical protein
MHQFGDSQVMTQQEYEAQIRARVLEGSFAPGTHAPKLLMPDKNAARTFKFQGHRFRGRLEIPGLGTLPEQDFSFHFTESGGYIKNHPEDHWPSIRINFTDNTLGIGNLQVAATDHTIEAGFLATRLLFALFSAREYYLQEKGGARILELGINRPTALKERDLLSQAKLFHKLKFIETVFKTKFLLPDAYSSKDMEMVEIVFRGITEGEFTTRSTDITFYDYKPSDDELNSPPFTGPGSISHTFANQNLAIFDRVLSVGSITIRLNRAGLANPRALDQIRSGERQSTELQFIIFDQQITYRFEKYATRPQRERKRKLDQFKSKLMREEPAVLADLLAEHLILDVSAERAGQIVSGWLQYYNFPDRYCPQEPELEEGRWRVPIWITYPRGRGAWVQDAFVDLKTGAVTLPVSVEELRNLGKSVAAESLRAS